MTRFGWVAFAWISIAGCGTTNEVACTHGSDCAAGMVCIAGQCTAATGCVTSRQCPGLVCDTTMGACVECVTAADCDAPLVCIDSVCGTASAGMDSGVDAGRDAFIGMDAFALPRDVGVGDARDAFNPRDAGIDADAVPWPDAVVGPDAMSFPDAYVIPDAFVPTDTSGCDPGLRYCSGHCVDTTSDPMNCSNCGIACPGGYACMSSGCMCITRCSGVCTDTTADPNNCGGCGHACAPGDYCRGSACYRPPCPTSQISCGGGCIDTLTDDSNCGACGNVCPSTAQFCHAGTCTSSCNAPLTDCRTSYPFGCRDTASDPLACGGCGRACDSDQLCEAQISGSGDWRAYGHCVPACSGGLTQCGRSCVNPQLDTLNCGSCGHACAPDQSCSAGVCRSCPLGQSLCAGACIDTLTDDMNCGACGNVCPSTAQFCHAGTCTPSCNAPLTDCRTSYPFGCRDTESDPLACGGCGRACDSDQLCEAQISGSGDWRAYGHCVPSCSAGLTQCGRSCVNPQLDTLNCGSCGHACAPDESCSAGVCRSCPLGQSLCGPSCVDTLTDDSNCGACGNVCPSTAQFCHAGTCTPSCNAPLTDCRTSYPFGCRDTESDPLACGGCGRACDSDQLCEAQISGSGDWRAYGHCVPSCSAGLTQCGRSCVNPQLDTLNCGSCGHACAPDESCSAGVCRSCPLGQSLCGPSCVDTLTDDSNCGACGNVCPSTAQFCHAGTCTSSCNAPLTDCRTSYPFGCRDTASDPLACGGCGRACDSDQLCEAQISGSGDWRAYGHCVPACSGGLTQCGRSCVNPQLDTLNCGSCGHACAPDQSCSAGVCRSCPLGQSLCAGACIDTLTDDMNCGACGNVCPSTAQFCHAGTCTPSCNAPLTDCRTSYPFGCRDTESDPLACGGCGRACDSDQLCEAQISGSGDWRAYGHCVPSCSAGLTQCGRSCVNPQLDTLNCGSCGHACAPDEYCVAGACAHATPD